MALAAQQVVDWVADRLRAVPAFAGKVHTSRLWPLTEDELPAWKVTVAREDVAAMQTIHSGLAAVHQHDLILAVSGYVRATDDLDDAMNALVAQGLEAICSPVGLQHLTELQGIDRAIAKQGECAMGEVTLRLRATFLASPANPETIL